MQLVDKISEIVCNTKLFIDSEKEKINKDLISKFESIGATDMVIKLQNFGLPNCILCNENDFEKINETFNKIMTVQIDKFINKDNIIFKW